LITAVGLLLWSRNARVLCELIDVAVGRTEVHPGIAAVVFLGEQNLDPVRPKLIGDRPDVVYEKAGDRTGREVAIHVGVWAEDLHFAPSGNFSTRNPGRSTSDRRPMRSRKKSAVCWKFSVRVPTQASLMIFTPVLVRRTGRGVN
jgi:hypothetical protein